MQAELIDDHLGTLELGCAPYVVVSVQLGSPTVREVMRNRSLANGAFDDTRFFGSRAITVNLRLKNTTEGCAGPIDGSMQELIDRVTPYMAPNRRPWLRWQLPGGLQQRMAQVRGASWPVTVAGPRYPVLPLQWVSASGELYDGSTRDPTCTEIRPSTDVEAGRHYNAPEDAFGPYYKNASGTQGRQYPAQLPLGARQINNPGTATANWMLYIYGVTTNPRFTINGTTIEFDRNGGINLVNATDFVVVDSRERTVLLNGDPAESRYNRTNYAEWMWEQVKLQPGTNLVRFDGDTLTATSRAVLCYRPAYL